MRPTQLKPAYLAGLVLLSIMGCQTLLAANPELEARGFLETDPLCNFELNEVNDEFTGLAEGAVYTAIVNADSIARDALKNKKFGPIYISPNPIDCTEEKIKNMGIGDAWKTCLGMPELLVKDRESHPGFSRMAKPYGPAAVKIENIEILDLVFENGENKAKLNCNRVECKAQFPISSLIVKGDVYLISLIDLVNKGVDFDGIDKETRDKKIDQTLIAGKEDINRMFHLKDWQFTIQPEALAPYITYRTCVKNGNAPNRKTSISSGEVLDKDIQAAIDSVSEKKSRNPVSEFFSSFGKWVSDTYEGCISMNKVVQLQPTTGQLDLTVRSMSANYYIPEEKLKAYYKRLRSSVFKSIFETYGSQSQVINSVNQEEEKQSVGEAIELILSGNAEIPNYENGNKAWLTNLKRIHTLEANYIDERREKIPQEISDLEKNLIGAKAILEKKETEFNQVYLGLLCPNGLGQCAEDKLKLYKKTKRTAISTESWAVQDLEDKIDRLKREVSNLEWTLEYNQAQNYFNAKRYYGLVNILGLELDIEYLDFPNTEKFEKEFFSKYNFSLPMKDWTTTGDLKAERSLRASENYQIAFAKHKEDWLQDGIRMREHAIQLVLNVVSNARYEALKGTVLSSHHKGRINDFHMTVMFFSIFNSFIADGGLFLDTFSSLLSSSVLPPLSKITNGFLERAPLPVCVSGQTVN